MHELISLSPRSPIVQRHLHAQQLAPFSKRETTGGRPRPPQPPALLRQPASCAGGPGPGLRWGRGRTAPAAQRGERLRMHAVIDPLPPVVQRTVTWACVCGSTVACTATRPTTTLSPHSHSAAPGAAAAALGESGLAAAGGAPAWTSIPIAAGSVGGRAAAGAPRLGPSNMSRPGGAAHGGRQGGGGGCGSSSGTGDAAGAGAAGRERRQPRRPLPPLLRQSPACLRAQLRGLRASHGAPPGRHPGPAAAAVAEAAEARLELRESGRPLGGRASAAPARGRRGLALPAAACGVAPICGGGCHAGAGGDAGGGHAGATAEGGPSSGSTPGRCGSARRRTPGRAASLARRRGASGVAPRGGLQGVCAHPRSGSSGVSGGALGVPLGLPRRVRSGAGRACGGGLRARQTRGPPSVPGSPGVRYHATEPSGKSAWAA